MCFAVKADSLRFYDRPALSRRYKVASYVVGTIGILGTVALVCYFALAAPCTYYFVDGTCFHVRQYIGPCPSARCCNSDSVYAYGYCYSSP